VYTQDNASKPMDSIKEIRDQVPNINSGYGGAFVWLVQVWAFNSDEALSSIKIIVQNGANPKYNDLSKGAGGKFRYLRVIRDSLSWFKTTQVLLARGTQELEFVERNEKWFRKTRLC